MALRTINAPGVEIREVDMSDYSRSLVGSDVLVCGFASKGPDYLTNKIGSKTLWTQVYGTPETEAERYFYKACMEAIEQGANLHCAKIPYVMSAGDVNDHYCEEVFRVGVRGQYLSGHAALSSITEIDPSIQKFFYIENDLPESEAEVEIINEAKERVEELSATIHDINLCLEKGESFLGEAGDMAYGAINSLIEALNDDSPKARSVRILRLFRTEEDIKENKARNSDETAKQIRDAIYNNIHPVTETPPERDLQEINVWLGKLKASCEKSVRDASLLGGVVSDTVKYLVKEKILDNVFSKYPVDETRKSKSKKDTAKDTQDTVEPVEMVDLQSLGEILVDLVNAWNELTPGVGKTSSVKNLDADDFDDYDSEERKPDVGTIHIVDVSRAKYGKAITKNPEDPYYKECLGIMPVITTAANALYCQQILPPSTDGFGFNLVKDIRTSNMKDELRDKYYSKLAPNSCFVLEQKDSSIPFGVKGSTENMDTAAFRDSLTMRGNDYFPALFFNEDGVIDREHLKEIGIVVFKVYVDANQSSKVSYQVVESFVGSLDPDAINPSTHASTFIDRIVNSRSEYIKCFSNVVTDTNRELYNNCDIGFIHDQYAGSMGMYEPEMFKYISYKTITDSLTRIFDRNSDLNETTIDIVCDAGVSTIGQAVKDISQATGIALYDPALMYPLRSDSGSENWRAIINMYDTFCKKTRKDCMYIVDAPRNFALDGKRKAVRETKKNTSIDLTIIPRLRYIGGTNSSYGAGYCDWFSVVDDYSGESYWCPPSVQAMGCYVNCDINYNYWDAPAGMKRGIIAANDVAFNPNIQQAGNVYLKNWNYAVKYPDEGVILEGQKTFQTRPSAFDRVNVRRLFLRLERYVWRQARYFVYEPNTAVTRQRFHDRIDPYFQSVKAAGGMYDYRIICDETVNTPETIDNNELRVVIGIKPTKTIEFILIQFVALRTGGSWEELANI